VFLIVSIDIDIRQTGYHIVYEPFILGIGDMIWAYWGKNCRFPPNNWIIVTPISNRVLASPCHKIAAG